MFSLKFSCTATDLILDQFLTYVDQSLTSRYKFIILSYVINHVIFGNSPLIDPGLPVPDSQSFLSGSSPVWNAVCNKNPLLFPLQITLLSDFISLFPWEIRTLLFPKEIRTFLFPKEISL